MQLRKVTDYLWEVPRQGKMRVPARIYTRQDMLAELLSDNAPEQAANVAQLPGIVTASLAMPDIHWGYGFPIGGVAAFDAEEGVISPGGVGYDINCGVRLMATRLTREEVKPQISELMNALFRNVPSGVGSSSGLKASKKDLEAVARGGAAWAVDRGYGRKTDTEHIEENGCLAGAAPENVSDRAWQRGGDQVGTLGSGNHFLEVGCVDEVYDETAARVLGLPLGTVTAFIHCGSRGFGHQICDDYLATMDRAASRYNIELPDRQLACAPLGSAEAKAYFGAMCCAVNYAFANRQVIAHATEQVFNRLFGDRAGVRTVYEVAHNIAKFETHMVEGRERRVCIHRKGATRAFPAGHPAVPSAYRQIGQPVLIPGDMGRYSFVLLGTPGAMEQTFGSTCHGAGRHMSRHAAMKIAHGRNVAAELRARDILVIAQNRRTLDEELPEAYKDVSDVVDVCVAAGISRKVVRLHPLGCIKG
jgi:tRNA-splicing ligase RtcB